MYSAEEYRRCLKLLQDSTELERKTIFSNDIYPSDSYLMGELVDNLSADKFIEAVRQWESRNKVHVTWIKTTKGFPENETNHYVKLQDGTITAGHFSYYLNGLPSSLYGVWTTLNGEIYPVDIDYSSQIKEWSLEPVRFNIAP